MIGRTTVRAGRLTGSMRRRPLRRAAVGLATLAMLMPFAAPAATVAQGSPLVDFCVGVDHPPFERSYQGDGASYVLIAVSVDGVVDLRVRLSSSAGPSEQTVSFSGPDRAMVSFPIFQYDTYPWIIQGPGGATLERGSLVVGPSEVPCSAEGLAAAPSAAPSVTPSAAQSATPEPASSSPSAAVQTPAPTTAPPPGVATPSPSEEVGALPGGGSTTAGFGVPWLLLILVGLLLALAGTLIMFLGVDWSGTTRCPDECPTLGAKRSCTLSAFGISSQGRTPDNDAGIDLALTLLRYAPVPGMGTGAFTIGRGIATGAVSPMPLAPTASGAARGPTIDMTRELHGYLNNRYPQIWIKVDYQECRTARCFPQIWRTYRTWVSTTSEWTQVREGTQTVADPMGVFPRVSDWTNLGILRGINQAIVDTVNGMGCQ